MKNILVIGAGRSSAFLINYLLNNSTKEDWKIRVGDVSLMLAQQKTANHPNATAFAFDVKNEQQRHEEIQRADIVISMLPPTMHIDVAKDCVYFKKHLVTASYVSNEMNALHQEAKQAGVILLNECGLDPGIDHASAMKVINNIHSNGGVLTSFKSYCGGLIAPEDNDNPWGYKFSWNPKNVILAGQGTSKFIEKGKYRYIPYNRLFLQTEKIMVNELAFEAYANRDSLSYRKLYHLENIPTMLRGTLRMPGYCKAWNVFVKLGLTDDSYMIDLSNEVTYKQLLESYLPSGKQSIQQKLIDLMGDEMDAATFEKIAWTGILNDTPIDTQKYKELIATPAQLLLDLLEEKWKLQPNDKDMVVMQHLFDYTNQQNEKKSIISSLIVIGQDQSYTAMAKTVGLPLAIATKLILQNKVQTRGVTIPTIKEIYEPLLMELKDLGIKFEETRL